MYTITLPLVCLACACACSGRRVPSVNERLKGSRPAEHQMPLENTLASFLLALHPVAAFNPSGPGHVAKRHFPCTTSTPATLDSHIHHGSNAPPLSFSRSVPEMRSLATENPAGNTKEDDFADDFLSEGGFDEGFLPEASDEDESADDLLLDSADDWDSPEDFLSDGDFADDFRPDSSDGQDQFKEVGAEAIATANAYRKSNKIRLKFPAYEPNTAANVYLPIYDIEETPFEPVIKDVFKELGFEKPTPIQSQSWSLSLAGRDMVSVARSGSGKTFAFLLPAFHRLMQDAPQGSKEPALPAPEADTSEAERTAYVEVPHDYLQIFAGPGNDNFKKLRKRYKLHSVEVEDDTLPDMEPRQIVLQGPAANVEAASETLFNAINSPPARPRILVLAPTRELVSQIATEADKFARAAGIRVVRLVGGGSMMTQQIFLLRTINPEFIIATPGRCADLNDLGELDLKGVQHIVLDEADRILEMGFESQIRKIFGQLPRNPGRGGDRHTLMFSATWPEKVRTMSCDFLHEPVIVNIGEGDAANANRAIKQHFRMVRQDDKVGELLQLLEDINPNEGKDPDAIPKTLVFVAQKKDVEFLTHLLRGKGYGVEPLHSRMQQFNRTKIMNRYRKGDFKLLVATDVAQRGLDVTDIEVVVNYDMPSVKGGVEHYIHRIGRTARADNDGISHSFFTKEDHKIAKSLVGVLERAGQEVPDKLRMMVRKERRRQRYH